MDNTDRKAFWDVLYNMHDVKMEHIQSLQATIKLPECLCRFRSVSESSLLQLQENKLYYSSADYYDDPFDTYLHFDYGYIKTCYEFLNNNLDVDNPIIIEGLRSIEPLIGMSAEQFMLVLKSNPLELTALFEWVKQLRINIQKTLFSICFCEDSLNETLWLKYASNYRGFALVYNVKIQDTFLCGKEKMCQNCTSLEEKPFIYPVYYTEEAYNATIYALACLLLDRKEIPQHGIIELCDKITLWEAERVSLIKKKCHEYDEEWRMIRPSIKRERTCIKMRPQKVILGLRMPEYERMMVVAASKIAGINHIEELYIDDSDKLSSRELLCIRD